jgi:hypothetical protein
VVQFLTNASVMVQSIENQDSSGSKTAHLSLDEFSASINTAFKHVDFSLSHPIMSPIAADFRAVYQTVNEGFVVSKDFSFDCESVKCCMVSRCFIPLTTPSHFAN